MDGDQTPPLLVARWLTETKNEGEHLASKGPKHIRALLANGDSPELTAIQLAGCGDISLTDMFYQYILEGRLEDYEDLLHALITAAHVHARAVCERPDASAAKGTDAAAPAQKFAQQPHAVASRPTCSFEDAQTLHVLMRGLVHGMMGLFRITWPGLSLPFENWSSWKKKLNDWLMPMHPMHARYQVKDGLQHDSRMFGQFGDAFMVLLNGQLLSAMARIGSYTQDTSLLLESLKLTHNFLLAVPRYLLGAVGALDVRSLESYLVAAKARPVSPVPQGFTAAQLKNEYRRILRDCVRKLYTWAVSLSDAELRAVSWDFFVGLWNQEFGLAVVSSHILENSDLIFKCRVDMAVRGLHSDMFDWRLKGARELSSMAVEAESNAIGKERAERWLKPPEYIGIVKECGILPEMLGPRMHSQLLKEMDPVLSIFVRHSEWNAALTTKLWLTAHNRHSAEVTEIFNRLEAVLDAESLTAANAVVSLMRRKDNKALKVFATGLTPASQSKPSRDDIARTTWEASLCLPHCSFLPRIWQVMHLIEASFVPEAARSRENPYVNSPERLEEKMQAFLGPGRDALGEISTDGAGAGCAGASLLVGEPMYTDFTEGQLSPLEVDQRVGALSRNFLPALIPFTSLDAAPPQHLLALLQKVEAVLLGSRHQPQGKYRCSVLENRTQRAFLHLLVQLYRAAPCPALACVSLPTSHRHLRGTPADILSPCATAMLDMIKCTAAELGQVYTAAVPFAQSQQKNDIRYLHVFRVAQFKRWKLHVEQQTQGALDSDMGVSGLAESHRPADASSPVRMMQALRYTFPKFSPTNQSHRKTNQGAQVAILSIQAMVHGPTIVNDMLESFFQQEGIDLVPVPRTASDVVRRHEFATGDSCAQPFCSTVDNLPRVAALLHVLSVSESRAECVDTNEKGAEYDAAYHSEDRLCGQSSGFPRHSSTRNVYYDGPLTQATRLRMAFHFSAVERFSATLQLSSSLPGLTESGAANRKGHVALALLQIIRVCARRAAASVLSAPIPDNGFGMLRGPMSVKISDLDEVGPLCKLLTCFPLSGEQTDEMGFDLADSLLWEGQQFFTGKSDEDDMGFIPHTWDGCQLFDAMLVRDSQWISDAAAGLPLPDVLSFKPSDDGLLATPAWYIAPPPAQSAFSALGAPHLRLILSAIGAAGLPLCVQDAALLLIADGLSFVGPPDVSLALIAFQGDLREKIQLKSDVNGRSLVDYRAMRDSLYTEHDCALEAISALPTWSIDALDLLVDVLVRNPAQLISMTPIGLHALRTAILARNTDPLVGAALGVSSNLVSEILTNHHRHHVPTAIYDDLPSMVQEDILGGRIPLNSELRKTGLMVPFPIPEGMSHEARAKLVCINEVKTMAPILGNLVEWLGLLWLDPQGSAHAVEKIKSSMRSSGEAGILWTATNKNDGSCPYIVTGRMMPSQGIALSWYHELAVLELRSLHHVIGLPVIIALILYAEASGVWQSAAETLCGLVFSSQISVRIRCVNDLVFLLTGLVVAALDGCNSIHRQEQESSSHRAHKRARNVDSSIRSTVSGISSPSVTPLAVSSLPYSQRMEVARRILWTIRRLMAESAHRAIHEPRFGAFTQRFWSYGMTALTGLRSHVDVALSEAVEVSDVGVYSFDITSAANNADIAAKSTYTYNRGNTSRMLLDLWDSTSKESRDEYHVTLPLLSSDTIAAVRYRLGLSAGMDFAWATMNRVLPKGTTRPAALYVLPRRFPQQWPPVSKTAKVFVAEGCNQVAGNLLDGYSDDVLLAASSAAGFKPKPLLGLGEGMQMELFDLHYTGRDIDRMWDVLLDRLPGQGACLMPSTAFTGPWRDPSNWSFDVFLDSSKIGGAAQHYGSTVAASVGAGAGLGKGSETQHFSTSDDEGTSANMVRDGILLKSGCKSVGDEINSSFAPGGVILDVATMAAMLKLLCAPPLDASSASEAACASLEAARVEAYTALSVNLPSSPLILASIGNPAARPGEAGYIHWPSVFNSAIAPQWIASRASAAAAFSTSEGAPMDSNEDSGSATKVLKTDEKWTLPSIAVFPSTVFHGATLASVYLIQCIMAFLRPPLVPLAWMSPMGPADWAREFMQSGAFATIVEYLLTPAVAPPPAGSRPSLVNSVPILLRTACLRIVSTGLDADYATYGGASGSWKLPRDALLSIMHKKNHAEAAAASLLKVADPDERAGGMDVLDMTNVETPIAGISDEGPLSVDLDGAGVDAAVPVQASMREMAIGCLSASVQEKLARWLWAQISGDPLQTNDANPRSVLVRPTDRKRTRTEDHVESAAEPDIEALRMHVTSFIESVITLTVDQRLRDGIKLLHSLTSRSAGVGTAPVSGVMDAAQAQAVVRTLVHDPSGLGAVGRKSLLGALGRLIIPQPSLALAVLRGAMNELEIIVNSLIDPSGLSLDGAVPPGKSLSEQRVHCTGLMKGAVPVAVAVPVYSPLLGPHFDDLAAVLDSALSALSATDNPSRDAAERLTAYHGLLKLCMRSVAGLSLLLRPPAALSCNSSLSPTYAYQTLFTDEKESVEPAADVSSLVVYPYLTVPADAGVFLDAVVSIMDSVTTCLRGLLGELELAQLVPLLLMHGLYRPLLPLFGARGGSLETGQSKTRQRAWSVINKAMLSSGDKLADDLLALVAELAGSNPRLPPSQASIPTLRYFGLDDSHPASVSAFKPLVSLPRPNCSVAPLSGQDAELCKVLNFPTSGSFCMLADPAMRYRLLQYCLSMLASAIPKLCQAAGMTGGRVRLALQTSPELDPAFGVAVLQAMEEVLASIPAKPDACASMLCGDITICHGHGSATVVAHTSLISLICGPVCSEGRGTGGAYNAARTLSMDARLAVRARAITNVKRASAGQDAVTAADAETWTSAFLALSSGSDAVAAHALTMATVLIHDAIRATLDKASTTEQTLPEELWWPISIFCAIIRVDHEHLLRTGVMNRIAEADFEYPFVSLMKSLLAASPAALLCARGDMNTVFEDVLANQVRGLTYAESTSSRVRWYLSDEPSASLFDSKAGRADSAERPGLGLRNQGATCYMNATLQQFFMLPAIRHGVLAAAPLGCEVVGLQHADRLMQLRTEVQTVFTALALSNKPWYDPVQLVDCLENKPSGFFPLESHVRSQNDANEFFVLFLDKLSKVFPLPHSRRAHAASSTVSYDSMVVEAPAGKINTRADVDAGASSAVASAAVSDIFTAALGFKIGHQIIGRGGECKHRRSNFEPTLLLSLDVQGKETVESSLQAYVQGELLAGDNAYNCEECGKKVDTMKRSVMATLPDTLVLHLKRFDMDWNVDPPLKKKINEELIFGFNLDMWPYTAEGLAEAEGENIATSTHIPAEMGDDGSAESRGGAFANSMHALTRADCQYELTGVMVHSGTATAGHYYSYIKRREYDDTPAAGSGLRAILGAHGHDTSRLPSHLASILEEHEAAGAKFAVAGEKQTGSSPVRSPDEGWFEFNDERVLPFDASDESALGAYWYSSNKGQGRSTSAFMLFYDRKVATIVHDTPLNSAIQQTNLSVGRPLSNLSKQQTSFGRRMLAGSKAVPLPLLVPRSAGLRLLQDNADRLRSVFAREPAAANFLGFMLGNVSNRSMGTVADIMQAGQILRLQLHRHRGNTELKDLLRIGPDTEANLLREIGHFEQPLGVSFSVGLSRVLSRVAARCEATTADAVDAAMRSLMAVVSREVSNGAITAVISQTEDILKAVGGKALSKTASRATLDRVRAAWHVPGALVPAAGPRREGASQLIQGLLFTAAPTVAAALIDILEKSRLVGGMPELSWALDADEAVSSVCIAGCEAIVRLLTWPAADPFTVSNDTLAPQIWQQMTPEAVHAKEWNFAMWPNPLARGATKRINRTPPCDSPRMPVTKDVKLMAAVFAKAFTEGHSGTLARHMLSKLLPGLITVLCTAAEPILAKLSWDDEDPWEGLDALLPPPFFSEEYRTARAAQNDLKSKNVDSTTGGHQASASAGNVPGIPPVYGPMVPPASMDVTIDAGSRIISNLPPLPPLFPFLTSSVMDEVEILRPVTPADKRPTNNSTISYKLLEGVRIVQSQGPSVHETPLPAVRALRAVDLLIRTLVPYLGVTATSPSSDGACKVGQLLNDVVKCHPLASALLIRHRALELTAQLVYHGEHASNAFGHVFHEAGLLQTDVDLASPVNRIVGWTEELWETQPAANGHRKTMQYNDVSTDEMAAIAAMDAHASPVSISTGGGYGTLDRVLNSCFSPADGSNTLSQLIKLQFQLLLAANVTDLAPGLEDGCLPGATIPTIRLFPRPVHLQSAVCSHLNSPFAMWNGCRRPHLASSEVRLLLLSSQRVYAAVRRQGDVTVKLTQRKAVMDNILPGLVHVMYGNAGLSVLVTEALASALFKMDAPIIHINEEVLNQREFWFTPIFKQLFLDSKMHGDGYVLLRLQHFLWGVEGPGHGTAVPLPSASIQYGAIPSGYKRSAVLFAQPLRRKISASETIPEAWHMDSGTRLVDTFATWGAPLGHEANVRTGLQLLHSSSVQPWVRDTWDISMEAPHGQSSASAGRIGAVDASPVQFVASGILPRLLGFAASFSVVEPSHLAPRKFGALFYEVDGYLAEGSSTSRANALVESLGTLVHADNNSSKMVVFSELVRFTDFMVVEHMPIVILLDLLRRDDRCVHLFQAAMGLPTLIPRVPTVRHVLELIHNRVIVRFQAYNTTVIGVWKEMFTRELGAWDELMGGGPLWTRPFPVIGVLPDQIASASAPPCSATSTAVINARVHGPAPMQEDLNERQSLAGKGSAGLGTFPETESAAIRDLVTFGQLVTMAAPEAPAPWKELQPDVFWKCVLTRYFQLRGIISSDDSTEERRQRATHDALDILRGMNACEKYPWYAKLWANRADIQLKQDAYRQKTGQAVKGLPMIEGNITSSNIRLTNLPNSRARNGVLPLAGQDGAEPNGEESEAGKRGASFEECRLPTKTFDDAKGNTAATQHQQWKSSVTDSEADGAEDEDVDEEEGESDEDEERAMDEDDVTGERDIRMRCANYGFSHVGSAYAEVYKSTETHAKSVHLLNKAACQVQSCNEAEDSRRLHALRAMYRMARLPAAACDPTYVPCSGEGIRGQETFGGAYAQSDAYHSIFAPALREVQALAQQPQASLMGLGPEMRHVYILRAMADVLVEAGMEEMEKDGMQLEKQSFMRGFASCDETSRAVLSGEALYDSIDDLPEPRCYEEQEKWNGNGKLQYYMGASRAYMALVRTPRPHRTSFTLDALVRALYQEAMLCAESQKESKPFMDWGCITKMRNVILDSARGSTVLNYVMGGTTDRPVPMLADVLRLSPAYEFVWWLMTAAEVAFAAHRSDLSHLVREGDERLEHFTFLPLFGESMTSKTVDGTNSKLSGNMTEAAICTSSGGFGEAMVADAIESAQADAVATHTPPWLFPFAGLGRVLNPARCPELSEWLIQLTHPLSITNVHCLRKLICGNFPIEDWSRIAEALNSTSILKQDETDDLSLLSEESKVDDSGNSDEEVAVLRAARRVMLPHELTQGRGAVRVDLGKDPIDGRDPRRDQDVIFEHSQEDFDIVLGARTAIDAKSYGAHVLRVIFPRIHTPNARRTVRGMADDTSWKSDDHTETNKWVEEWIRTIDGRPVNEAQVESMKHREANAGANAEVEGVFDYTLDRNGDEEGVWRGMVDLDTAASTTAQASIPSVQFPWDMTEGQVHQLALRLNVPFCSAASEEALCTASALIADTIFGTAFKALPQSSMRKRPIGTFRRKTNEELQRRVDNPDEESNAPGTLVCSDDEDYISMKPKCYYAEMRRRRDVIQFKPWSNQGREEQLSQRPLTWALMRSLFTDHMHSLRGKQILLACSCAPVLEDSVAMEHQTAALLSSVAGWGMTADRLKPTLEAAANDGRLWSTLFGRLLGFLKGIPDCYSAKVEEFNVEKQWLQDLHTSAASGNDPSPPPLRLRTCLVSTASLLCADWAWPLVSTSLALLADALSAYEALADRRIESVVAMELLRWFTTLRTEARQKGVEVSFVPSANLRCGPDDGFLPAALDMVSWLAAIVHGSLLVAPLSGACTAAGALARGSNNVAAIQHDLPVTVIGDGKLPLSWAKAIMNGGTGIKHLSSEAVYSCCAFQDRMDFDSDGIPLPSVVKGLVPIDVLPSTGRQLSWAMWRRAIVRSQAKQSAYGPDWDNKWHVPPSTPLLAPAWRSFLSCMQGRAFLTTLLRARLVLTRSGHEELRNSSATNAMDQLKNDGIKAAMAVANPDMALQWRHFNKTDMLLGAGSSSTANIVLQGWLFESVIVALHSVVRHLVNDVLAKIIEDMVEDRSGVHGKKRAEVARILCPALEGLRAALLVDTEIDDKDLVQFDWKAITSGGKYDAKKAMSSAIQEVAQTLVDRFGLPNAVSLVTWLPALVLALGRTPAGAEQGSHADVCGGLLADPMLTVEEDLYDERTEFHHDLLATQDRWENDCLERFSACNAVGAARGRPASSRAARHGQAASDSPLRPRMPDFLSLIQALGMDCQSIYHESHAQAALYGKNEATQKRGTAWCGGVLSPDYVFGPTLLHGQNIDVASGPRAGRAGMESACLVSFLRWQPSFGTVSHFVMDVRVPHLFGALRAIPADSLARPRPATMPSASILGSALVFPPALPEEQSSRLEQGVGNKGKMLGVRIRPPVALLQQDALAAANAVESEFAVNVQNSSLRHRTDDDDDVDSYERGEGPDDDDRYATMSVDDYGDEGDGQYNETEADSTVPITALDSAICLSEHSAALAEMGFEVARVDRALASNGGDFDRALIQLVGEAG